MELSDLSRTTPRIVKKQMSTYNPKCVQVMQPENVEQFQSAFSSWKDAPTLKSAIKTQTNMQNSNSTPKLLVKYKFIGFKEDIFLSSSHNLQQDHKPRKQSTGTIVEQDLTSSRNESKLYASTLYTSEGNVEHATNFR